MMLKRLSFTAAATSVVVAATTQGDTIYRVGYILYSVIVAGGAGAKLRIEDSAAVQLPNIPDLACNAIGTWCIPIPAPGVAAPAAKGLSVQMVGTGTVEVLIGYEDASPIIPGMNY